MTRWLRYLSCACSLACSVPGGQRADGSAGQGGATGGGHAGMAPGSAGDPGLATSAGASAGGASGADGNEGAGAASGGGAGAEPDPPYLTGLEPTEPYPASVYPAENLYAPEKALLGKILFWEEQLSSHDTHACGTCHRPSAGGSDPRSMLEAALGAGPNGIFDDQDDARGSLGVARCDAAGAPKADPVYGQAAQVTPRKAPSALDAWFFEQLFWDGRATSNFLDPVTAELALVTGGALESQAAMPPVSSVEMSCEGYDWTAIEHKLAWAAPLTLASQVPTTMSLAISAHPTYPALFEWAYGTPEVTARRVVFAIATYERELRSDQTPWDRFNAGDTSALTADEQAGLALFNVKARCATCHAPPLFTDKKFHDIGAQLPSLDPGRASVSGEPADLGKMKTPSLRNVSLRAAGGLLHFGTGNGATLRGVLDNYRQGGAHQENLDPEIHVLNLPEFEFEQLLEFVEHGLVDARAAAELPPFDRPRLGSEK